MLNHIDLLNHIYVYAYICICKHNKQTTCYILALLLYKAVPLNSLSSGRSDW